MTVVQLKEQLAGVPDDAVIVLAGSDHSYRKATVDLTTALEEGKHLSEDFGTDQPPEFGKRIPVLLFS